MLAIRSNKKKLHDESQADADGQPSPDGMGFFDQKVDENFWGERGSGSDADPDAQATVETKVEARVDLEVEVEVDYSDDDYLKKSNVERLASSTALRVGAVVTVLVLLGVIFGVGGSEADDRSAGADPVTGYPWCADAASDLLGDSIGDGYGWENNRSCRVKVAGRPADSPRRVDALTGYPWCENPASDFVGDSVGDGYGWEFDETCRIGGTNPVMPAPPTTRGPVRPPTTRSPVIDPAPDSPRRTTTTEPFRESPPTEAPITAPTTGAPTTTPDQPADPAPTTPTSPVPGAPVPAPAPPAPAPPAPSPSPDPTHGNPDHPGHPMPPGGGSDFESMRNDDPKFSQFASVPSNQLSLDALTFQTSSPDNGSVGDGQFRAACEYSHFAYDDPIVHPGQPGKSHFHMFFGNTQTNAHTNDNSLINSGGSTCNGFELNRSAYWTPALLDGQGNAVVPDQIILYYKTKQPGQVQAMPQGLKMIAGNTTGPSFTANQNLHWSCGDSGTSYNRSNTIPNCNGDTVNAAIVFPNCWDGRNLDSAGHQSHLKTIDENATCPSSHPVRLPQISILLYFPGGNTSGWHLSSDAHHNAKPGSTLHADWYGAWNNQTMDLWTDGCMKAARNCSYGQTGTNRQLAKLNGLQSYEGPNRIPIP